MKNEGQPGEAERECRQFIRLNAIQVQAEKSIRTDVAQYLHNKMPGQVEASTP